MFVVSFPLVFVASERPVSGAPRPDDALQLIGLHPDDLFNPGKLR